MIEKIEKIYHILGLKQGFHKIQIGTILQHLDDIMPRDYSGEASIYVDACMKLIGIRKDKRQSLYEVSDDCIEHVYNLLSR